MGVCYYPEHWPRARWALDAQQMVDAGITLVRIGEFSWSRVEPAPDRFAWGWLDDAVETLAAAGLQIVMGTPTTTPPRWMITKWPDMLPVGADGRTRGFGSRRHYAFAHAGYRAEAVRIATLFAERFGKHDALAAWQLDNEYGCHDTTLSYCAASRAGFRAWLGEKYGSIDALNTRWGSVFWSMEYGAFDEIDLPNASVTEPNPAHALDFRRFASDMVIAFNRAQADAIRPLSPGRPLLHNYMGRVTDFDHYTVGADLDIAAWDSYPLGFLEDRVPADDAHRATYARQGDPDFQAFHHDLYRTVGRGRWWVIEQQPGPVNWAPRNPVQRPGMLRLWCHEAFAHGAEAVSPFRWRQLPFAQEQMHAGLLDTDGNPTPALAEISQTAREIAALEPPEAAQAPVALVFDYPSEWAWKTTPHSCDFSYFALVFSAYRALRRLGLSIDILDGTLAGLSSYALTVVPGLFALSDHARAALSAPGGRAVIGPRTGSKTQDFAIPQGQPPGLSPLMDVKVMAAETIRPDCPIPAGDGAFTLWREHIVVGPNTHISGMADDGFPISAHRGGLTYLAGWPDAALWRQVLKRAAHDAGLQTHDLPDGLRLRDHGKVRTLVNYGNTEADAAPLLDGFSTVLGAPLLPPAGVTVALRT